MKEKCIFSKAKENIFMISPYLRPPWFSELYLQCMCSQPFSAQTNKCLCFGTFSLWPLSAATRCREGDIARQWPRHHRISDLLIIAVCTPDVPLLTEAEMTPSKAGLIQAQLPSVLTSFAGSSCWIKEVTVTWSTQLPLTTDNSTAEAGLSNTCRATSTEVKIEVGLLEYFRGC